MHMEANYHLILKLEDSKVWSWVKSGHWIVIDVDPSTCAHNYLFMNIYTKIWNCGSEQHVKFSFWFSNTCN